MKQYIFNDPKYTEHVESVEYRYPNAQYYITLSKLQLILTILDELIKELAIPVKNTYIIRDSSLITKHIEKYNNERLEWMVTIYDQTNQPFQNYDHFEFVYTSMQMHNNGNTIFVLLPYLENSKQQLEEFKISEYIPYSCMSCNEKQLCDTCNYVTLNDGVKPMKANIFILIKNNNIENNKPIKDLEDKDIQKIKNWLQEQKEKGVIKNPLNINETTNIKFYCFKSQRAIMNTSSFRFSRLEQKNTKKVKDSNSKPKWPSIEPATPSKPLPK